MIGKKEKLPPGKAEECYIWEWANGWVEVMGYPLSKLKAMPVLRLFARCPFGDRWCVSERYTGHRVGYSRKTYPAARRSAFDLCKEAEVQEVIDSIKRLVGRNGLPPHVTEAEYEEYLKWAAANLQFAALEGKTEDGCKDKETS